MPIENFSELEEDEKITGPFWDEPIKIIKIVPLDSKRMRIEGEGTRSSRHYKPILTVADLSEIRKIAPLRDLEGDAEKLQLGLIAEQIRMTHTFDPFFGLSVSKVDPVPHQLEAVYDYILKKPRISFLLADDAGAGKTIMSGLVLKELKYRGLADRVLIVTPKYLSYLWERELLEKFDEEYAIVDGAVLKSFPTENIWQKFNHAIVSMDFAKQDHVLQSLNDVRWNLVIIDEAHKLAAYRRTKNKIERTKRFKLGRVLEQNTDNLLLLTATPHKGDIYNFFLLLSLLDREIFDPGIVRRNILSPSEIKDRITTSLQNEENPIFLRRMKEDMKRLDGSLLFPPRKPITLKYTIKGKEKELYNAVTSYVERYYKKATRQKRTNVAFALIIIQRRFASSIHAGLKSLERRLEKIEEILEYGPPEKEFKFPEGIDSWEKLEEKLEDLPEKERWKIEEKLSRATERGRLSSAENKKELELEKEKLEELVKLAREVESSIEERKLKELWKVFEKEDLLQTGNKILVFTEAKDTLSYLVEKFQQRGYNTATIHGDKSLEERKKAEESFNEGNAQVMVATEAAGEGINLQKSCWLMINYDIPWNPNRLEQRMGRIHRYGQNRVVHVYNLVAKNTREGRVLSVVLDKLEEIRDVLEDDKVFDVVGKLFEGKSLETLISNAIAENKLSDVHSRLGKIEKDAAEKIKEYAQESLAKKHIDLSHVADLLRKNKEERLPPEYIEEFFVKAFTRFDGRIEKRSNNQWYINYVPAEIRNASKKVLFEKRYGEVKKRYGLITFHRDIARERGGVDFITPGHPLLEALTELVNQKCYSDLKRGSFFYDPEGKYNGVIWFFESTFKDGLNDDVDKSVVPIYQPLNGEPRIVSMNLIWDLVPGELRKEEKYARALESERDSLSLFFDRLDENRRKITQNRRKKAKIRKNSAVKTKRALIADSESKIMKYQKKQEEGKDMRLKIDEERRRKEELKARLDKIDRETKFKESITYENPKILTSIVVLPHPSPEAKEMYRDEEVERIAMRKAIEYERKKGRNPKDVSGENLGYDILSVEDGKTRYIEVKGRTRAGQLSLTTNEWIKANRFGNKFWLYIVTNTKENPELYIIQDPASHLEPNEEIRYLVSKQNWLENAKKVD